MRPNPAKLMHGGKCSNGCMISDRNVSGERCGICHDDVVSHDAVMGDVTVGHQKIIVSNNGNSMTSPRSAVQAHKLPEYIIIADFEIGRFPLVFEVLRIGSDRTVTIKTAPFPDAGPAMNANMRIQNGSRPNRHIRSDDTVGADFGFRGNFTRTVNNGRRVYGHLLNLRFTIYD
jgi:hypothetical protein